jgi:hypothetical protein
MNFLCKILKYEIQLENKYGYQLGAKYYNALKLKICFLQLEYNVCPIFIHSMPINYGHNNQSIGHHGAVILGINCYFALP